MKEIDKNRAPEYVPDGPVRSDLMARLEKLERAVMALERIVHPVVRRTEPGPIDLDDLVRRVAALEAK